MGDRCISISLILKLRMRIMQDIVWFMSKRFNVIARLAESK
jgi:hypothetical protein